MTIDDAARIAKEISALWGLGPSAFWTKAADPATFEAKRVAQHFAEFLPDRVLRAVRDCTYEDPKRAPNIAQVLERTRSNIREAGKDERPQPDQCDHPQPWAILDDHGPKRDAMCRLCLLEFNGIPADKVRTATEVEDMQRRKAEARAV